MTRSKRLLTALTTVAAAAGSANAAVITWGSATDVVGTSDVSTTGTTVEAFNLGYSGNVETGPPTVTVNTVEFTGLTGPTPLTETNGGAYGSLSGNTSGNADYNDLLNSVAYGGGGGLVEMTVGGGDLVNGSQYLVQVWFVEERLGVSDRVMQFGDGEVGGNTVNVGGTAGLLGQYAIGTFTADAANQTLTLAPQGFGNSHMNAYQIRLVPEPSSLALLGMGGLLIARRRRG